MPSISLKLSSFWYSSVATAAMQYGKSLRWDATSDEASAKRDRRVRTVALTHEGKKAITPVYERHVALMERLLEPLDRTQRASLEAMMKAVGKHAETLEDMPDPL